MAKGKLSDRQRRIIDFIQRFTDENGYPPSIRQIGEAANISSTSVVNYNLNKLVDAGYIDREEKVSRGLRLTEKADPSVNSTREIFRVPIVGRIFASEPVALPSTDSPMFGADEAIEITGDLLSETDDLFALEVKGDSMIDAMVSDGDIVVMKRDLDWRNGDMVAVWLKDQEETTLKYIFREGNRVRLQPANPTMDPIYIDHPETLDVQGKVMLVVRLME